MLRGRRAQCSERGPLARRAPRRETSCAAALAGCLRDGRRSPCCGDCRSPRGPPDLERQLEDVAQGLGGYPHARRSEGGSSERSARSEERAQDLEHEARPAPSAGRSARSNGHVPHVRLAAERTGKRSVHASNGSYWMGYGGSQRLSSKPILTLCFSMLWAHPKGFACGLVTSRQGRVFPAKLRKFQGFVGRAGKAAGLVFGSPSASRCSQFPIRFGSMTNRSTASCSSFDPPSTSRSSFRPTTMALSKP